MENDKEYGRPASSFAIRSLNNGDSILAALGGATATTIHRPTGDATSICLVSCLAAWQLQLLLYAFVLRPLMHIAYL